MFNVEISAQKDNSFLLIITIEKSVCSSSLNDNYCLFNNSYEYECEFFSKEEAFTNMFLELSYLRGMMK